ncbi:glycosyltransferase family 2 protein [candidate division KSB1 bacterium]|nr:glycosyltransferase family 2 protein [candidate division KSB1 bacterium]
MKKLSAIIITLNVEQHIEACLASLSFTDEIIVVDSGSTDRTVELAKQITDHVLLTEWKGYAEAKQFALENATGGWVLWVDADERVPESLAKEIQDLIQNQTTHHGFRVGRKAFFLGRWMKHGGWYPGYVVRLFQRESGRFNTARVHESLIIDGSIGTLKEPMLHYTDDSLIHYYDKFNKYTTLAAEDLQEHGRRTGIADLLFRPLHMFFKMYIFRLGLLDGIEGFLLAVFSSSYVFVKYAKLWEIQKKTG